jgi:hypothetical protein
MKAGRDADGCPIGYVPQHPYAFGFSVLKNVMIALPKGGELRRGGL